MSNIKYDTIKVFHIDDFPENIKQELLYYFDWITEPCYCSFVFESSNEDKHPTIHNWFWDNVFNDKTDKYVLIYIE